MGTYDVWLKTDKHLWLTDKTNKKLLEFIDLSGLAIYGVVTLPDGEQLLAGRVHTGEYESGWEDTFGVGVALPETLWFCETTDGNGIDYLLDALDEAPWNDAHFEDELDRISKLLEPITESWPRKKIYGWCEPNCPECKKGFVELETHEIELGEGTALASDEKSHYICNKCKAVFQTLRERREQGFDKPFVKHEQVPPEAEAL
jgi:hypothetical protein